MNARYAWLGVVVLVLAVGLASVRKLPPAAPAASARAPEAPYFPLALNVRGGAIEPADATAPLGSRLALELRHQGRAPARLMLSGYEHRFAEVALAPGITVRCTLLLDLPGEDFAWLLDGQPAGKLHVAGSHLVEGHR